MPYIKSAERKRIFNCSSLDEIGANLKTSGELNFAITVLIDEYLGFEYNYQKINDVMGALEGAKLEFYRRVAAPYEDKKIQENGDVYV